MCSKTLYCGPVTKIVAQLSRSMVGFAVAIGGAVQIAGNFISPQISSISALGWFGPLAMLFFGGLIFNHTVKAAACVFSDNRSVLLDQEENVLQGRLVTE